MIAKLEKAKHLIAQLGMTDTMQVRAKYLPTRWSVEGQFSKFSTLHHEAAWSRAVAYLQDLSKVTNKKTLGPRLLSYRTPDFDSS